MRANYEHGVLTVIIPTAERAKPRKVEVGVGNDTAQAIEAAGTEANGSEATADPGAA